jgi:hypothetical protein
MAKKKRKKKNRDKAEAGKASSVEHESAAGIGAAALANFSSDLALFGSRPEKPATGRPIR